MNKSDRTILLLRFQVYVQIKPPQPFKKPDYSGFFLLLSSIPILVPGNETQNVYFMCMPTNRIAAGLPAAYPLYFNSLVFKRVASAFSAFFAFFIFSVASTSLISLSLNDVTTQSSNRALDVPTYTIFLYSCSSINF